MVCQNVAPNGSEEWLKEKLSFLIKRHFVFLSPADIKFTLKGVIRKNRIYDTRYQKSEGIVLLDKICTAEFVHLPKYGRIVICNAGFKSVLVCGIGKRKVRRTSGWVAGQIFGKVGTERIHFCRTVSRVCQAYQICQHVWFCYAGFAFTILLRIQ